MKENKQCAEVGSSHLPNLLTAYALNPKWKCYVLEYEKGLAQYGPEKMARAIKAAETSIYPASYWIARSDEEIDLHMVLAGG